MGRKRTVQSYIFSLMRRGSFNYFDGKKTVRALQKNRKLWTAVLFTRNPLCDTPFEKNKKGCQPNWDLIPLRDMAADKRFPGGYWNADTLYILAKKKNIPKLKKLAKNLGRGENAPDSMRVISGKDCSRRLGGGSCKTHSILRLWWD